ncbi:DUF6262 family protein [Pseudonocardia sichuanensis]|uniref:Transposase n=1 Tax=Pseudonocardia kunmingensis TaxID=630975 RepID=A0A543D9L6_9PSEU|nr:DUF6262 family protein [Pseudonocardia kunmingensis]TQM05996.1 hypothetical protein FB558_6226 [Pseudonocardia kunmingensis]
MSIHDTGATTVPSATSETDGATVSRSAEAMLAARHRDSAAKRARVLATLDVMLADGDPITAAALARRAQVSTWLVYAPGIRDAVEKARDRQRGTADTAASDTLDNPSRSDTAAVATLRTDLALARAEITRLRTDRAEHADQLRRALGTQLDTRTRSDLVARIDELTRTNTALSAAAARHESIIHELRAQITTLEDDLAAARTSLRRMIRAENQPPTR